MQSLFIILLLLSPIFLLLGLVKPSIFSKIAKKELSRKQIAIFFSISTVVFFIAAIITTPDGPQKSEDKKPEEQQITTQNTGEGKKPEESQITTQNITVTSQIVKKVDKKCRYFFDIRNQEAESFEGSVEISLFSESGDDEHLLGKEVFETKSPIKQSLGDSVYFDINTCPVSIHGENGISKYRFVVKIDGNVVNQGEASISTEFEDTDSYSL